MHGNEFTEKKNVGRQICYEKKNELRLCWCGNVKINLIGVDLNDTFVFLKLQPVKQKVLQSFFNWKDYGKRL